ncbi:hypothetical protein AB205_0129330 [Aquarana catesbeiana]|uniref:Uncharacterized protein n=1 Tax=Aquarana catesbeiana TaxID=8400 RepID=A0A2G9REM9_AQUCT|nr:hypothetical protein AB205_0129330 [Aquarana catesbeiana]
MVLAGLFLTSHKCPAPSCRQQYNLTVNDFLCPSVDSNKGLYIEYKNTISQYISALNAHFPMFCCFKNASTK